jgi:hypothetical protein
MFSFSRMPTAQATVEPGWPAGQTNTPRNPDDIFIDFEAGIDQVQIESTIPSLKFTTTSGLNWRYADIRTDQYNVYPHGSQSYEANGNFFAWLGVTGDTGKIDFLGGGATYCSVLVSTYSGLVIDAYDSEDGYLSSSGWATNNTGTRTFTRLTVDAPAGKTIAYILIHDTGNYWLIDDLCTDANKAVIPVPGRPIGSHGDKFDIVFLPDVDYGSPADIDTWLPAFLQDVNNQIDLRLGAVAPITGNLDKFNFYYTRMQGDDGVYPNHVLPTDLTRYSPFANAYCILHTTENPGDWTTWGPPPIFAAEGAVGRSFIHEGGHAIFGLADEYDDATACKTNRFQPDPWPNVWDTEALGRADATSEGWNPDDIWMFTTCQGDWWKLGTTAYIMEDGTHFANGWGQPAARRVQGVLDQYPASSGGGGGGGAWEKSIWLNVQVSAGVFSLLEDSYITDSPPEYFPGGYEFTAKVFSEGGGLLGEFGIKDPRIVQAEKGCEGPAWQDSANFQLILPYFESGARVDLVESATGSVVLSVDISQYATDLPDLPPTAEANGPYFVEEGSCITLDGTGSSDPGGGPLTYAWDLNNDGVFETPGPTPGFCGVDGPNTVPVSLQVCNSAGLCATDSSTVTIANVAPTVGPITAPVNPVLVNTAINASASFTDPGILDTHTAVWDWGDANTSAGVVTESNGSGSVIGSHTYNCPGVYTITLSVIDDDGDVGTAVATVIITPQAMQSFVIKNLAIQWAPHKRGKQGSDVFSIFGRLQLPQGYTWSSLEKQAIITISIADKSGNDTVLFKGQLLGKPQNALWTYKGSEQPPGEGMNITNMTMWWAPQGTKWDGWGGFYIGGVLQLPEPIGTATKPANVKITLEIPVTTAAGCGSLIGEQTLTCRVTKSVNLWFYNVSPKPAAFSYDPTGKE